MMLTIANKTFDSRLFTGTGKFSNSRVMSEAILHRVISLQQWHLSASTWTQKTMTFFRR
jgi:thiazole synthase ThiGH ThiG subunit